MKSVKFVGRRVPVPGNPILRVMLGIILLIGGFLGFLPVLGFWMLPLGVVILSIDFPPVRRFRRAATVKIVDWMNRRFPALSRKVGLGPRRPSRSSAAFE